MRIADRETLKRVSTLLLWMLALVIVLQIADVVSTMRFVHLGGIGEESNPIARWYYVRCGMAGLWLHKVHLLVFLVPALLTAHLGKYAHRVKARIMAFGCNMAFLALSLWLIVRTADVVIVNLFTGDWPLFK